MSSKRNLCERVQFVSCNSTTLVFIYQSFIFVRLLRKNFRTFIHLFTVVQKRIHFEMCTSFPDFIKVFHDSLKEWWGVFSDNHFWQCYDYDDRTGQNHRSESLQNQNIIQTAATYASQNKRVRIIFRWLHTKYDY